MIALLMSGTWLNKGLQAFSYMLLHSLWQGLLLAVVTGCALSLAKKAAPATRYTIMFSLYLAFLAVCLGTFVVGWYHTGMPAGVAAGAPGQETAGLLAHREIGYWISRLAAFCTRYNHIIITIWFSVFVVRCWRMLRAVRYMEAIKNKDLHGVEADWSRRLTILARHLGIRQAVGLFESGITRVPVVMGHLKPVIYVPLGMLSNLPPDQVEAILLHELAHIRRYDYFVNLVQCVAEAMFFFNPGLLWVSSLLKEEREHCCDDVVLAHTGNKKQFIEALIGFKEQVLQRQSLALAFPGRKSQLIQRVSRIVYDRNNPFSSLEKGFLAVSFTVCLFLLVTLANKTQSPALAGRQQAVQPKQKPSVTGVLTAADPATGLRPVGQVAPARRTAIQQSTKRTGMAGGKSGVHKPDGARDGMATSRPVASEKMEQPMAMQEDAREQEKRRNEQVSQENEAIRQQHARASEEYKKAAAERDAARLQRELAKRHRVLADLERTKAEKLRAQAEQAREQAALLRRQAEEDRKKMDVARLQAEKERFRAEAARQEAERNREMAERDRMQAEKDRKRLEQYSQMHNAKKATDQHTPSTSY